MSSPLRKPLAAVTVVAASIAVLSGAGTATASQPGNPTTTVLTATSTSNTQILGLSSPLTPTVCDGGGNCGPSGVKDAQWSPDGSRAVFVMSDLSIGTVRYNDQDDTWYIADPSDGLVNRASPSYQGGGSNVVWAEQKSGHWYIARTSSSYGWKVKQISPTDATVDYTDPDGGPDSRIVAERNGNEVVLWDGSGETAADWTKIVDGADPAISPDGTKVAYVSGLQIWTADINGANAVPLTSDAPAGGYSNPTWSPDGATIAFNSGTQIRTVAAAGGISAAVGSITGKPAYQSRRTNLASRLAGAGRYETAAAVSGSYWKTKGNTSDTRHEAKSVVLSRSDTFADALGGSALAAAKEGPLLLTSPQALDAATMQEIDRVLNPGDTVYLLGGTGAISTTIEAALESAGYAADRVAGADRFSTAVEIAKRVTTHPDLILVATGNNFPDALGAGAAAGSFDVPGASDLNAVVVLTADKILPTSTKDFLDGHGASDIYAVGGQAYQATLPYEAQGRLWPIVGSDRFATSYFVAGSFFGGQTEAGVATGDNWPDALSGGALMATLNGPLLLSPGLAAQTSAWTAFALSEESASISTVIVFGGTGVVTNNQLSSFGTLISGPAGFTTGTVTFPATVAAGASVAGARQQSSAPTTASGQLKSLADIRAAVEALNDKH